MKEAVSNPEDMEITTNWDECTTSFDAMDFSEVLVERYLGALRF